MSRIRLNLNFRTVVSFVLLTCNKKVFRTKKIVALVILTHKHVFLSSWAKTTERIVVQFLFTLLDAHQETIFSKIIRFRDPDPQKHVFYRVFNSLSKIH